MNPDSMQGQTPQHRGFRGWLRRVTRRVVAEKPRSDTYRDVDWAIRIIAGVTINILLLEALGNWLAQNTINIPETLVTYTYQNGTLVSESAPVSAGPAYLFASSPLSYWASGFAVLFFISPFLLSLVLSRKDTDLENLRIVPPLAIGLPTAAYGMVFLIHVPFFTTAVSPAIASDNVSNFLLGFMTLFAFAAFSLVEDRWAVAVLGRTAEREAIYFEKILVKANIEDVRGRLLTPEIAQNLVIRENFAGDREHGFTARSGRLADIVTTVNLTLDRENSDFTVVNVAYYLEARYSIMLTNYLQEYVRKQSAYLHKAFEEGKSVMQIQSIVPLSNSELDPFINIIMDNLRGYYVQTRKAPRRWAIAVIAVVLLSLVTAASLVSGQPTNLIQAEEGIDALIAIIAILDFLSKRP